MCKCKNETTPVIAEKIESKSYIDPWGRKHDSTRQFVFTDGTSTFVNYETWRSYQTGDLFTRRYV